MSTVRACAWPSCEAQVTEALFFCKTRVCRDARRLAEERGPSDAQTAALESWQVWKRERRRLAQKRYAHSEQGSESHRQAYQRYDRSVKGRERADRHRRTVKGRATRRRYSQSDKGRVMYRAAWKRYAAKDASDGTGQ